MMGYGRWSKCEGSSATVWSMFSVVSWFCEAIRCVGYSGGTKGFISISLNLFSLIKSQCKISTAL